MSSFNTFKSTYSINLFRKESKIVFLLTNTLYAFFSLSQSTAWWHRHQRRLGGGTACRGAPSLGMRMRKGGGGRKGMLANGRGGTPPHQEGGGGALSPLHLQHAHKGVGGMRARRGA